MVNAPTTDRQRTRDGCPPWCDRMHLGCRPDPEGGFTHDRANASLLPAADSTEQGDTYLYVNVAQHQPAEGLPDPVVVELTAQEQVTTMTPAEARELARMLTEAAGTAACQPWCTEHLTETDACSTDAVEVPGSGGISMWASQSPADPAAVVSVDGHNAEGQPFELLLTLDQTRALATSLQQMAEVTGRG